MDARRQAPHRHRRGSAATRSCSGSRSPTGKRTQLTFGTHDEGGAQFLDDEHAGLRVDRRRSQRDGRSRGGQERHHLQHLDAEPEDRRAEPLHRRGRRQPLAGGAARAAPTARASPSSATTRATTACTCSTAASRSARPPPRTSARPGPIVDFQAPLTHTLVADNEKRKGKFEKLYLEGRPPVNVGLTSGGDFLGGTAIAFTDVLGDQQFTLFATSVSQYRSFSGSYINLERRFQYAVQGFSQTQFFYGQLAGRLLRPVVQRLHRPRPRRGHHHLARRHGVRHLAVQPLPPHRSSPAASCHYQQRFEDPGAAAVLAAVPGAAVRPAAAEQRHHGAVRPGVRAGDDGLPRVRPAGRQHRAPVLRVRARRSAACCRARPSTATPASTSASVARACWPCAPAGFKSWGDNPGYYYFGGNSEMRGYEYLEFVGQNAGHLNAELRIPLIHAMATPIGILGGVRGTLFANVGGAVVGQPASRPTRATRRSSGRSSATRQPTDRPTPGEPDLRRPGAGRGLPPGRRAGQLRHRPADLRARLPHPLRLELAHALQPGLGRRASSPSRAAARRSARPSSRCGLGTTSRAGLGARG